MLRCKDRGIDILKTKAEIYTESIQVSVPLYGVWQRTQETSIAFNFVVLTLQMCA